MDFAIRAARVEDSEAISALVMAVFERCVAPDLDEEGRANFARDTTPEAVAGRLAEGSEGWLAERANRVVGVLEMRADHLKSLFVAPDCHGQGLARRLLERALAGREGAEITVNSSPYAMEIYEHLGFRRTSDWTVIDGLRHQPMARRV